MAKNERRKRRKNRQSDRVRTKRLHHFRRRVKQRYGLELSEKDANRISSMIPRDPDVKELERLSNTKTRYRVRYRGRTLDVIYSTTSYSVITAIPFEEGCKND